MRRILLLTLAATLTFAAPAAAKPTCRSGKTTYHRAGIRIFFLQGTESVWYGCGPRTRRPVPLFYGGGVSDFRVHGRVGRKVLFEGEGFGEGGGEDTAVGWFDGRRTRSGSLAGSVSNEVRQLVVARDGGMGVVAALEDDQGVRVGYLAPGRRQLHEELALSVLASPFVRGSLAFRGRTLTWRERDAGARSAPLGGEPVACTSGTTLLEADGARVFEVLPHRHTERGFQADVLAACSAGATTPVELGETDVYDQLHWSLDLIARAGARVTFEANGIGLIDHGAVSFWAARGVSSITALALGDTGPVVFAGKVKADAPAVVARVSFAPPGFTSLAPVGGELAPGTLAVTADRATWRTTDGVPHEVALGTAVAGLS